MPKAKSKNAFFFFMLDWKQRAEAQGLTFPNGLKDVQANADCNKEWQGLTKPQKGPYESMAKDDKIASQITKQEKRTTVGESINMLQQKEEEEKRYIEDMCQYLKSIIVIATECDNLPQLEFCFIHVNWFFTINVSNRLEYFPAEYAIGVFSFENGIKSIHHTIVSVPIPLGYKREALETSQNGHQIPTEYPGGETDFAVMYEKLIEFLEPWKVAHKYPPLYTTKVLGRAVRSILGKLSQAAEKEEEFLVYEIESLFKCIAEEAYKKRADRQFKYIPAYSEFVFTRYNYIYKRGYECAFHKYVDGGCEHCSTSVLHQWTWKICDEFCKALEVPMISGIHFPKDADNIHDVTYSMTSLNIKPKISSNAPSSSLVSMTGVTEQHRVKVSERTYDEEMRRRNECKPIRVVDHSKLDELIDTLSIDDHTHDESDKTVEKTDNVKKTYVPNYLDEKQMRPPNLASCMITTIDDYIPSNDEKNFPPIGGRGVFSKISPMQKKKIPFGRGQGHA